MKPGETIPFKLSFIASIPKEYIFPLKYTINKKYNFKVAIKANVIAVEVRFLNELSRFTFRNVRSDSEKVEMEAVQILEVRNDYNAPAEFAWEKPKMNDFFSINPMKGFVKPKSNLPIEISFAPKQQKDNHTIEDMLTMFLTNGLPKQIKVQGLVPSARCTLREELLDFGQIHVGVEEQLEFSIKNEKNEPAAYRINNPFPHILKFDRLEGYVDKRRRPIIMTLMCTETSKFETDVEIIIRGGNPLSLKVKAEIVAPKVDIKETEFDFGKVGNQDKVVKTLTFCNHSNLKAKVVVDLESIPQFKDFKLEISSIYKGEFNNCIKDLGMEEGEESEESEREYDEEKEEEEEDMDVNEEVEEKSDESIGPEIEEKRHFEVEIAPKSELEFNFIFHEITGIKNTRLYDFYTNFQVKGIGEIPELKRRVKVEIVKSNISLSRDKIIFPKTFIRENQGRMSQIEEIRIANSTIHPLNWKLKTDEFDVDTIFTVYPKEGQLNESNNETAVLKFIFDPKKDIEYRAPVYLVTLDEDGNEISSKKIDVIGLGCKPRLYFDRREIIMPVVPLGVESRVRFRIKNDGFENARIEHRFTSEMGHLNIQVDYLDDHSIGLLKSRLRMEVYFTFNKPISFTGRLSFIDDENNETTIMISGTCENSLMTNYFFFKSFEKQYNLRKEENGAIKFIKTESDLVDLDDRKSVDSVSVVSSVNTRKREIKISKDVIEMNCEYLKNYINSLCGTTIKVFPKDVIDSNGEILLLIIENLSNKKVPNINFAIDDQDTAKIAHHQRNCYLAIIRHLQEQGAFLNTVFPEFLMDFRLYKKYLLTDEKTNDLLEQNWNENKKLKKNWQLINQESWIMLINQIIKIFFINRVNSKTFKKAISHLNQYQRDELETFVPVQSNLYSNSELFLLKWLEANINGVSPQAVELLDFEKQVSLNNAWSALVFSYFPSMDNGRFRKKIGDSKIISPEKAFKFLEDYGINSHLVLENILNPDCRQIIIYSSILFQNLQHFYNEELIEFEGILGDTIQKSISLFNPTAHTIEYFVRKEASDDFSFKGETEIKLEPGQEKEFLIYFQSRFSHAQEGKLYFTNKNEGISHPAAPLVYNLKSNIKGRNSINKEIKLFKSHLYEKTPIKLNIISPFKERPDSFEVSMFIRKKPVPKKLNRYGKKEVIKKEEPIYKVFYIKPEGEEEKKPTIKLEFDREKEFLINFQPIDMDHYICDIVFLNHRYGEFQYTIEGIAELPKYYESIERECVVDDLFEFTINVPLGNRFLNEAMRTLKFESGTVKAKLSKEFTPERLVFNVDSNRSYYLVPNQVAYSGELDTEYRSGTEVVKLPVKFSSKTCQTYDGEIILRNVDLPNDIRVYRVVISVKPKNIYATIEFNCPVGREITQTIPIQNNSDKDWQIKVELNDNRKIITRQLL